MNGSIQQFIKAGWLIALGLLLGGCGQIHAGKSDNTTADVPYQLQLKQLAGEDFPGLHSMIYASNQGKVIFMAGRINGLHGFPAQNRAISNPSFPKDKKNTKAYVIDQATGKVLASAGVNNLPSNVLQQLTSTNAQFEVVDNVLYIVGGYGYTDGGQMQTLQQVMAVALKDLIEAIENSQLNAAFAAKSIYVGNHPALAITGGDMQSAEVLGGKGFLLIFGQRFDGVYSTGGGTASQQYSESVRKFNFTLGDSGIKLSKPVGNIEVDLLWVNPPISRTRPVEATREYHRRDLSILPWVSPKGNAQIAALGGVFVPGQMAGFLNPVLISADEKSGLEQTVKLDVDAQTSQLMAQYKAGSVPVYSQRQQAMYVSIFAGISQYYWKDGKLVRDTPNFNKKPPIDGLPFINTVSTLKITPEGGKQYLHVNELFPPGDSKPSCGDPAEAADYLGAETVFIPAAGAYDSKGVIALDKLTGPTVVGYLAGGIAAVAPYPGPNGTCASATYYEVTLNPKQAASTTVLRLR